MLCRIRFHRLQQFAGGVVSISLNAVTVRSDFAVNGAGENVYDQSLIDATLGGILHAKQSESLRSLSTA